MLNILWEMLEENWGALEGLRLNCTNAKNNS